jgi:hypothetical protein
MSGLHGYVDVDRCIVQPVDNLVLQACPGECVTVVFDLCIAISTCIVLARVLKFKNRFERAEDFN